MRKVSNPIVLAYLAGVLTAIIWGGWMTVTKYAMNTTLNPSDIVFLRFFTATLISIPILMKRGLVLGAPHGFKKGIVITLGAGALYVFIASQGFYYAPSSYGSIIPISMTFFSIIFGVFMTKILSMRLAFSLFSILLGFGLFMAEIYEDSAPNIGKGILFFAIAGFCFATYNVCAKKWKISPLHAVAIVSLYSLIGMLPFYLLWGEPQLFKASFAEISLQVIYQGLAVSFIALICFGYASAQLGSSKAALFTTLAPVTSVVSSVVLLNEKISLVEVLTLSIMILGMFIGLLPKRKRQYHNAPFVKK